MKKILLLVLPLLLLAGCAQKEAQTPTNTATDVKVVSCGNDNSGCMVTNVIDNFTGCQPIQVLIPMDDTTNDKATITLSKGENGACRFQITGNGLLTGEKQDCLFAKENVTQKTIKGMLNMDNIPNDPAFQNIKAASCK